MSKTIMFPEFHRLLLDNPVQLVDIGARGGIPRHWKPMKEYLKIISFEPDKNEYLKLIKNNDKRNIFLNSALSDVKGKAEFYLMKSRGCSSLLEPNYDFLKSFPNIQRFYVDKTHKIDVDTLDSQLKHAGISDVDFLKIDTQGTELKILKGAEQAISRSVLGLEIEVEFAPIYKNQPLFSEVDLFLRQNGFELFDLQRYYWKRKSGIRLGCGKGQLIFANALYLRKIKDVCFVLQNNTPVEHRFDKVLRFLCVCSVYGYFDYARDLVNETKEIIGRENFDSLTRWLKKKQMWEYRIPNFYGKGILSNIFYFLFKIFRVKALDGAASYDIEIANK